MKIIEKRYLFQAQVRSVCIAEDFYTCGTSSEYDNMLEMVDDTKPATAELLYALAKDIFRHSKTRGVTENEGITHIMFVLCRKCVTCFEIES